MSQLMLHVTIHWMDLLIYFPSVEPDHIHTFWSNGSTNQNLNAVISGSYTVTITDFNGCTHDTTITIGFLGDKSITQSLVGFSPDPLTAFHTWSYDTLTIQNTGCDVNLRPDFTISHDSLPIQQGDFVIKWYNPITTVWNNIPYDKFQW